MWLFDIPVSQIDMVHPQSIIHSMVESTMDCNGMMGA